jgi:uncharacterized membrane protein YeaQ/YmgE (transglycosylase-associated protein family)
LINWHVGTLPPHKITAHRRSGTAGATVLNLYSVLVAIVGAALLLIVYHAGTRGSR